jgi:hypothetical protein
MYVMWFYTASQHIGAANFNSTTLANYSRTATNIPITMSRTLLNPGPTVTPSVKQPYVQVLRWQNNTMSVVSDTGAPDGWIKALGQ